MSLGLNDVLRKIINSFGLKSNSHNYIRGHLLLSPLAVCTFFKQCKRLGKSQHAKSAGCDKRVFKHNEATEEKSRPPITVKLLSGNASSKNDP